MLNDINEFAIALTMFLGFLLAAETGCRFGRRFRAAGDDHVKTHVGALQGALLGLLALLLGFTLAMAVSRYDTRKDLVIAESNAIGTAYLRTRLLGEPYRAEAANLLRAYVDARLAFYNAGNDAGRLEAANTETARLQQKLWAVAVAAATQEPRSIPAGLFVQSLNELIDLHEKRLRALENRVPEVVFYLLFAVAAAGIGFIGYGSGLNGRRYFKSTALVSLLIVLVIVVIVDLDRPRRGLITVSQNSMLQLKKSVAETRE